MPRVVLPLCTSCNRRPPTNGFASCTECRTSGLAHYYANRAELLVQNREDYAKGSSDARVRLWRLVEAARARAARRDLPFDLTVDDLVLPATCPLLGIPLRWGNGKHTPNSPSLDRRRPELGYTRANVWVISMRANLIKQDATLAELQALVHNLERQEWL